MTFNDLFIDTCLSINVLHCEWNFNKLSHNPQITGTSGLHGNGMALS